MVEQPDAREGHGDAVLVAGLDDVVVPDGAAWFPLFCPAWDAALPCGYFLRSFFFLLSFIYYLLFVEKDTLTPSRGNKDVFTLLKIHV